MPCRGPFLNVVPLKNVFKIIHLVLFGNIYVALGAVFLIQSTSVQLQLNNSLFAYSFLVFFSTLFIYNVQRFFYKPQKDKSLNSIRRKWIFEHQGFVKTLAIIGFLGVGVAYFFNNANVVYYLSPLLILSLFYFSSAFQLRKSPFFKLLTLVTVWTVVTAIVPVLLLDGNLLDKQILAHFALRFCFMMAICIPFDIRDLQVDMADEVSTLPHLIGEDKARWTALLFMMAYLIIVSWEYTSGMTGGKMTTALTLSAVINSVPIFLSSSRRNEYFYVAWLDGTMIIQGLIIMGAQMLS